jgi:hypothetical protein
LFTFLVIYNIIDLYAYRNNMLSINKNCIQYEYKSEELI